MIMCILCVIQECTNEDTGSNEANHKNVLVTALVLAKKLCLAVLKLPELELPEGAETTHWGHRKIS